MIGKVLRRASSDALLGLVFGKASQLYPLRYEVHPGGSNVSSPRATEVLWRQRLILNRRLPGSLNVYVSN